MQPNYGPAPGSPVPYPSSNTQYDKFLEKWWLAVPGRLRQYSVYLSETWADGIYLTGWPRVAAIAPLVLLFFGFLEGTSHWTFSDTIQSPSEVPLTFTQMLPLMVLTAAVSALSTNFGFVLVLGYALGDYLVAGFRLTYAQGARGTNFSALDPGQSFFHLHLAQLISYVLFLLLVITPTLSSKYLVPRLKSLTEPTLTLVRTGALMIIQGAIVYAWTLSAPLLIRVFWAWTNDQPPLSAAYYLQQQGGWVVTLAVVGIAVREWLSYKVRWNRVVTERIERQASTLRAADTRLAFSRKLPPYIRAILTAGVLTLLISGFIPSLLGGMIIFLFLSFLLMVRTTLLPSLPFWKKWLGIISRIPLAGRLVAGALISYVLSQVVLSFYWNQPITNPLETFLPVLISVAIAMLVMTAFVPPTSQLVATPSPAKPPVSPSYGSPPPLQAIWPVPPAQPPSPVQPSPMWQTPSTQPPPMWQTPSTQPPPTWQVPPVQPPPPPPPQQYPPA